MSTSVYLEPVSTVRLRIPSRTLGTLQDWLKLAFNTDLPIYLNEDNIPVLQILGRLWNIRGENENT